MRQEVRTRRSRVARLFAVLWLVGVWILAIVALATGVAGSEARGGLA